MVAELPLFTFPDHGTPKKGLARFSAYADPSRRRAASKTTWRMIVAVVTAACFALVLLQNKQPSSLGCFARWTARTEEIDWAQYAYVQYVTTEDYLCNSVMIFESLTRLGSKANRVMLYPEQWSVEPNTTVGKLLLETRDRYRVTLQPVSVQTLEGDFTWAESFTKLLAFNQTQYGRVLSLDSDGMLLQHMDELFLLPPAPLAAPRAYWLPQTRPATMGKIAQQRPLASLILSSQVLLLQPSLSEFERVLSAFDSRLTTDYDMEIVNILYNTSALVLPHRAYNLLTGEFKPSEHNSLPESSSSAPGPNNHDHSAYLGSPSEIWDPDSIIDEAKYVHFSDWPVPKPWIFADKTVVERTTPKCSVTRRKSAFQGVEDLVEEDCRDREIWLGLYEDFRRRRREICGLGLVGGWVGR